MTRLVALSLTRPQADALRWLANCGLDHATNMRGATRNAGRRAIAKLLRALGLHAYRTHSGAVRGRRHSHLH